MTSSKKRKRRSHEQQAEWLFKRHRNFNLLAQPGIFEFIVVLDHVKADYNIGKIFRSADAFGAREVHLIGIEKFDPASARGSFKWVPAKFHQDTRTCFEMLIEQGYALYALSPGTVGLSQSIFTAELPARSAFIVGHEEFGHSFDSTEFPNVATLTIPQFGKVQSLNVSVAASIMMYEYIRQNKYIIPSY